MSLIENLKIEQKDFTLDIPRMEIIDHGIHLLWGPSGSGKTTFLRALLGLEKIKNNFSWKFGDIDLAQLKTPDRRIGVVFQTMDLFPHMTARENILFAAEARNISSQDIDLFFKKWIEPLRMSSFLDRQATVLSGGEQQRVALLRALIARPRVLFLDEPFSHLDPKLRDEARQMILTISVETQLPILIISHDEQDKTMAQAVTQIRDGRLL